MDNHITGTLVVLPLAEDGSLLPLTQKVQLTGEPGPHRKEQSFTKPHFNPFDPSGQFVFVPDKGLDKVFAFRFTDGELHAADVPDVMAREASGPRHLAFHPTKPWVYVVNELDSKRLVERSFNNYSYGYDTIMLPRNILSVLYGGSYVSNTVQDKVSVKLEQQIDRIFEKIEQKLDQKARAHLEHLAWERDYERKKAIREHNERVIEDREQQLERAIAESLDFEKSQQLKRYLKQLSLAIERLPEEQRAYGLAWLRMVREQRKGLNPIAERLESFRTLASEQAGDSEEYWGLELIGDEYDPEFDEALEDERLTFGW